MTAATDFRTAKQLLDEDLSRRIAWLEQFSLEALVTARDVGAHKSVLTILAQIRGLATRAYFLVEGNGGP